MVHRLTATATDIGKPGRDDECGYGVLNIVKALTADIPPPADSTTSASPSPTPTNDNAAPPPSEPAGNNTAAIIGGTAATITFLGALTAYLLLRRRHRTRKTS